MDKHVYKAYQAFFFFFLNPITVCNIKQQMHPPMTSIPQRGYRVVRKDHQDALQDFPNGSGVKNPPASAGDTGLILDPGRCHMLWGNEAHLPQLLSLPAASRESPRAATKTQLSRKEMNK